MEYVADIWKVVGGASKGGIIVRAGQNVSSPEHPERLGTGAKVRVVDRCADRLRYELISGKGPQTGWVTASCNGKELIVKLFKGSSDKQTKDKNSYQNVRQTQHGQEKLGQIISPNGESTDCLTMLDKLITGVKEDITSKPEESETNCIETRDCCLVDSCQDAVRRYGQRLKEQSANKLVDLKKVSFLNEKSDKLDLFSGISGNVVGAELVEDLGLRGVVQGTLEAEEPVAQYEEVFDDITHSEPVCPVCNLPIGDISYDCSDGSMRLHGECVAQWIVNEWRFEDENRLKQDLEKKKMLHEEYNIGWDIKHIPRNDGPASRLSMQEVPQGMVCLVSDEKMKSVSIASTMEPAASVNLEYLSIALEVRRKEGHEPVFSLDPSQQNGNAMQSKDFAPKWLAGTSVGELLFQADYHLKELSMGEYEQPVVGMKSCFDFMELGDDNKDWNAREWFIVRKAEVRLAESHVLIPFVKMGVEAREQTVKGNSLVDKQITRAHHPMVKYAETFTRNFDLIAERKSVIFHLRELAKATVLAKHLLDAQVKIDEIWFELANGRSKLDCCMFAPQVWNERLQSQVQVQDGEIVDDSSSRNTHGYGVYGGVHLGLDKFELSIPTGVRQASSTSHIAKFKPGFVARVPQPAEFAVKLSQATRRPDDRQTFTRALAKAAAPTPKAITPTPEKPKEKPKIALPETAPRAAAIGYGVLPRTPVNLQGPENVQQNSRDLYEAFAGVTPGATTFELPVLPSTLSAGLTARIQGVDLRLDSFDVSEPKQINAQEYNVNSLDKCTAFGDFFWSSLETGEGLFKEEDRLMLKEVFNPVLSDRRQEGELFTPPDVSHSYITKLRALVKEEELVRQRRKDIFFGKTFKMGDPGPLFPSSWSPSFEIARGRTPIRVPEGLTNGTLEERPEYCKGRVGSVLTHVLQVSAPVFDRSTEEGIRFRIFRLGSLEVRTTQEVHGEQVVGAVYSIRTRHVVDKGMDKCIQDEDMFFKVTEYVEAAFDGDVLDCRQSRYYVVLATAGGHQVVTERLYDGRVTWEVDPEDLDDRNSLAKVMRSFEHSEVKAMVGLQEMVRYRAKVAEDSNVTGKASSPTDSKKYATETIETFLRHSEQQTHVALPTLNELAREMREGFRAQEEERARAKATVTFQDDSDLVD